MVQLLVVVVQPLLVVVQLHVALPGPVVHSKVGVVVVDVWVPSVVVMRVVVESGVSSAAEALRRRSRD